MSRVCFLVLTICLLAVIAPVRAQPAGEEKKYAKEIYFDFKGKPLPDELTLVGKGTDEYVRFEPQGLRMTLPADRASLFPVGVGTRFGVSGDFEITATVEILHADIPKKEGSFGVGATLYINKVDPPTEGTNIGRLMKAKGDTIMWDRRYDHPDKKKPTFAANFEICTDKLVRLRLQRTGDQLAYWWAVGASGAEFKKLHQAHFGGAEVKQVSLRAATGQQLLNVDVRLIDLRIRSGGLTEAAPAVVPAEPGAKSAPAAPTTGTSGTWLVVLLLIVLTFAMALIVALLAWIFLRKTRPNVQPDAASAIAFACPQCARGLKVPTDMAGKKVKCARCGEVVLVPAT